MGTSDFQKSVEQKPLDQLICFFASLNMLVRSPNVPWPRFMTSGPSALKKLFQVTDLAGIMGFWG
jgi:hypothetical protein